MQAVTLKLRGQHWYAQFHNCPEVEKLFGSPFVKTPYTYKHDPDWVLIEVLLVLDECIITLERSESIV